MSTVLRSNLMRLYSPVDLTAGNLYKIRCIQIVVQIIHKPIFREHITEPMCEEARPPMISPIQSNPIQPEPVVMPVQSMPLQNDVQRKPSGASSPTTRTRSSKLRKTVLKSGECSDALGNSSYNSILTVLHGVVYLFELIWYFIAVYSTATEGCVSNNYFRHSAEDS